MLKTLSDFHFAVCHIADVGPYLQFVISSELSQRIPTDVELEGKLQAGVGSISLNRA